MGMWDDVDYRKCDHCGETRPAATSKAWPSGRWTCMICTAFFKKAMAARGHLAN